MTTLRGLLFPLLLVAGLLVPGWLLSRLWRTRAGPVGAFLGSLAILFNLVLLLDALGRPLDLRHLSAGLALVCAALVLLAGRRPASDAINGASAAPTARLPFRWQRYHWFFVPAALGLAAIVIRATLEPLSGFDTIFRWNFLALQMLREGSLQFYPPITAQDFLHYGWPDGIAPFVSTFCFWCDLAAGHTASWLTAPVDLGQGALLFFAVWQLAALHERRFGALACAVRLLTLALGAVLGGVWLARLCTGRRRWRLVAVRTGATIDVAVRSLHLPVKAVVRWWTRAVSAWQKFDRDGQSLLVPDPATHALFVRLGAHPIPPFGPAIRFLCAPDADFNACLTRLRAGHRRFVLVTRVSNINERLTATHPFFRTLDALPPMSVFPHYRIYDHFRLAP